MDAKNIKTRYVAIEPKEDGCNYIKQQLYYSKGGPNMFTYKNEQRGYYISVTPVKREDYFESFTAFAGYKKLIHPVARQSAKAEQIALGMFDENVEEIMATCFSDYTVIDPKGEVAD